MFKNKGERKDVENYRPISNLGSSSEIFEKLILKRILEIQDDQHGDITGRSQHGFKKKRSIASLSLTIQVLADWFTRKNSRRHNGIYNVYYY